jgi:hypothetical protein
MTLGTAQGPFLGGEAKNLLSLPQGHRSETGAAESFNAQPATRHQRMNEGCFGVATKQQN